MPIRLSVGADGDNSFTDVVYVQYLLDDWRERNNLSPIGIDGLVGPETIGAIQLFQQRVTGIVDGRVDPNGPALRELERLHMIAVLASFQDSPAVRFYQQLKPGLRFKSTGSESTLADAVQRFFATLQDGLTQA